MGTYVFRSGCALFLLGLIGACSNIVPTQDTTVPQSSEEIYCTAYSKSAGSTPLTITGLSATYSYYATIPVDTDASISVDNSGLDTSVSSRGIAYAEVVIKDSSGRIVQCSETDASGTIQNFQIPKVAGVYTVYVNSRAENSKIKVSVLKDVSSSAYYSASTTFTVTGSEGTSKTVATVISASATDTDRTGAAFHILYNIYIANEYLRNTLSDATFTTDKVTIFWKSGFNPGAYVGTTSALSFYIQGSRELYILGGSNGNSTTADTDHFDDSVILHEFGHFLEDVYSKSDSQGGSHNGNFIIDPRLAWSEGWANFFQGAVIRSIDSTRGRYYIDTIDGDIAIKFDLREDGGSASYDMVSQAGEGTFREVSISRTLWKTTASAGESTTPTGAALPFAAVWKVFTDASAGIKNPLLYFRNIGMFNQLLNDEINANYSGYLTAWSNVIANERQNTTTKDYADPVSIAGSCASYPRSISPVADGTYSFARSNLLRSNDFYHFTYTGGGGVITLTYSTTATTGTGDQVDLDLYIYKNGYVYQEDYHEANGQSTGGVSLKSDRTYGIGETGTETVNLSSLTPGYYLINVKANTYEKNTAEVNGTAEYSLSINQGSTQWLCPQNN